MAGASIKRFFLSEAKDPNERQVSLYEYKQIYTKIS